MGKLLLWTFHFTDEIIIIIICLFNFIYVPFYAVEFYKPHFFAARARLQNKVSVLEYSIIPTKLAKCMANNSARYHKSDEIQNQLDTIGRMDKL